MGNLIVKRLDVSQLETFVRLLESPDFQVFIGWIEETLEGHLAMLVNPAADAHLQHLAGQCYALQQILRELDGAQAALERFHATKGTLA